MREQLIALGSLLLVLASLLVRSSINVLVAMGVLWLLGVLWPVVAAALGIPQKTLYGFVLSLPSVLAHLVRAGG